MTVGCQNSIPAMLEPEIVPAPPDSRPGVSVPDMAATAVAPAAIPESPPGKLEPMDTILSSLSRSDPARPCTPNDLAETLDPKQYPSLCLDEKLNCVVVEFYRNFFAQFSGFSEHYNNARKHTELKESDWNELKGANNSFAREVQYSSPINTPLPSFVAKKTTRVREVQSCRLVKDHSFVLETSMVMLDIPYGDSFEINVRWDVRAAGGGSVGLRIHADVKFKKSTMFASKIKKDTIAELKNAYAQWFSLAQDVLSGKLPVAMKQPTSWQAVQRAHHQASLRNLASSPLVLASDAARVSPIPEGSATTPGRQIPSLVAPNSPIVPFGDPGVIRRNSSQNGSMSRERPESEMGGGWLQGDWVWNSAKISGWILLAYVLISICHSFLGVSSTLEDMRQVAGACSAMVQRGGHGGARALPSADYFLDMKLKLWQSALQLAADGRGSDDASCPAGGLLAQQAAHADAQAEIIQHEIDAVEARLISLRRQRDWHQEQVKAVQEQLKMLPACS